jgi:iron(III) transport system ATP-binding protein
MHLREGMRSEFRRLHDATGATMMIVTHDQADALSLADLVVVMEAGRILQAAPPVEVYARPANLAVARLIGRSVVVTAERGRWRDLVLPGAEGHDGPVVIRPEGVALAPGRRARVVERVFLGDRWRLSLEVDRARLEAYAAVPPVEEAVDVEVTRAWPLPA